MPFLTIFDTPALVEMIQGLLTLYQVQGWLPDCHMSLNKGYTQGGSNADVVMADAYVKLNKTAEIDWDLVYEAVVKDAEEEPYGMWQSLDRRTWLTSFQTGVAKVEEALTAGSVLATSRCRTSTTRASEP